MNILIGIVAIIATPFRFAINHPKQAGILVIVGVILFSGYKVIAGNQPAQVKPLPTPAYQLNTPKASYAIQTSSRLYYTNNVTDSANIVKASGYWDYTQKKWIYHKTSLTLDRKYFGEVKVYETN